MDRAIFIFYVAGSYGSFLSHCLNFSEDLINYKFKTLNIFDKSNSAHLNIREYIHKFHNSDDLMFWENLSNEDSKNYLLKHTIPIPENLGSGMYTQRCAYPNVHSKVKSFFPNSKFVNISFNDDDIPVISDLHSRKTISNFIISRLLYDNMDEYNYLKTLDHDEKLRYYYNICLEFKKSLPRVANVPYMFDFHFKWFYNKQQFMIGYEQMCSFLGIRPGDISKLYDNFAAINNIKVY